MMRYWATLIFVASCTGDLEEELVLGEIESAVYSTTLDGDGDGVPDAFDNCVQVSNGPNTIGIATSMIQRDSDGNGVGDACSSGPSGLKDGSVRRHQLMFITRKLVGSNVGSLAGADGICQTYAQEAGLTRYHLRELLKRHNLTHGGD